MICAASKEKTVASSPLSRLRWAPARQTVACADAQRAHASPSLDSQLRVRRSWREGGFTLVELLVVMGIIAILMVLIAPAFTTIKGGTDATSAAYTIKGALDTAGTYAKANNTYTWVGFYEENVSNPLSPNPDAPAIGRLVMSIIASSDGTNVAASGGTMAPTKLIQVGKLTKIANVHIATNLPAGSGASPGSTFETRPPVATSYCLGDTANSTTPFQYPVGNPAPPAQYTFLKAVQFSPRGEARINNNSNSLQEAVEVGVRATHGTSVDTASPNLVAVQVTGVGADVTIYRK